MVFLSFPRRVAFWSCGSGRDEEPSGEEVLRLIQIRLATASLEKIYGLGKTKTTVTEGDHINLIVAASPCEAYRVTQYAGGVQGALFL